MQFEFLTCCVLHLATAKIKVVLKNISENSKLHQLLEHFLWTALSSGAQLGAASLAGCEG